MGTPAQDPVFLINARRPLYANEKNRRACAVPSFFAESNSEYIHTCRGECGRRYGRQQSAQPVRATRTAPPPTLRRRGGPKRKLGNLAWGISRATLSRTRRENLGDFSPPKSSNLKRPTRCHSPDRHRGFSRSYLTALAPTEIVLRLVLCVSSRRLAPPMPEESPATSQSSTSTTPEVRSPIMSADADVPELPPMGALPPSKPSQPSPTSERCA
jgi:hypothetical protein